MKGNKKTLELKIPEKGVVDLAIQTIERGSDNDGLGTEAIETLKKYINGSRFKAEKLVMEHFEVSGGQEFVDIYGRVLADFIGGALEVEIFPGVEEQEEEGGEQNGF
jgi:hypothetical protein